MNARLVCRSLPTQAAFAHTRGFPSLGSIRSKQSHPHCSSACKPSLVSQNTQATTRQHRGLSNTMSDLASKAAKSSDGTSLSQNRVPIFTKLAELRGWREGAFREGKSVGFVPTMGALHEGHITLVRESLKENDLTVVSIFVNPTQFAPHEDLSTYPRTLESDVALLSACSVNSPKPSSGGSLPGLVLFLPSVPEMYPFGVSQSAQIGTYVLPPPHLTSQMEGSSRPTFFRGVATVITKLLNAVLPTRLYLGQKDIQQALLVRNLLRDLCSATKVKVVKTVREDFSQSEPEGLALSSRNMYLSPIEREVAPTLRRALSAVEGAWYAGAGREDALAAGRAVVEDAVVHQKEGVKMRLDYIEMNDPDTFKVISNSLRADEQSRGDKGPVVILSGALWVGKTRLIDNILLGDASWVFE